MSLMCILLSPVLPIAKRVIASGELVCYTDLRSALRPRCDAGGRVPASPGDESKQMLEGNDKIIGIPHQALSL